MRIIAGQRSADPTAPACAGMPIDAFFPRDNERAESWAVREQLALQVCAGCPIRTECREESLRFSPAEQHGVAGGLTSEQRRAEIRNRRRRAQRTERRAA
jgi:WhiB family transcriptional regulator, redox-sensing transcriptional regulator